ncbi:MAG TPA: DUF2147 domain-containing protein [Cyclobacteriaceae bacterium]
MTNLTFLLFAVSITVAQAQDVIGKWKTIDDETGDERSIVDVYEKNGKVYGKVVKLFRVPGEDPDPVCTGCDDSDDRFNKKIIGMEILRDMEKSGDEYSGGNILDPKNGRVYRCSIWVEGNELKVRGYWGPFYRTQTWLRAQ